MTDEGGERPLPVGDPERPMTRTSHPVFNPRSFFRSLREKKGIGDRELRFGDFELGMWGEFRKQTTEADINDFAKISGDKNPVHLDATYAAKTQFGERIAHGMLTAAYISAAFGMEIPGPGAIYISQTLNFMAPVKIGDMVTAKVEVAELLPPNRVRFHCQCSVDNKAVIIGEAVLMVPE